MMTPDQIENELNRLRAQLEDERSMNARAIAQKNAQIGDLKQKRFSDAVRNLPEDPLCPHDYKPIVAYLKWPIIVILEGNGVELPENHNCDCMGCGSLFHVAYRMDLKESWEILSRQT